MKVIERLKEELEVLTDKKDKLKAFMNGIRVTTIDERQIPLMVEQYVVMCRYITILKQRIALLESSNDI
jgi:hypothetical protein